MPDQTTVLKVAAVELRLQVRNFAFWAIAAVWQGLITFTLVDSSELSPSVTAWGILGQYALFLGTAAVLYFTYVLSREETSGMAEMLDTFPHRAQDIVWGKLLGTGLLWTLLGLEVVVIYAANHLRLGLPVGALVRTGGYMLAYHLAVSLAAAGVGLLCASTVPRSRLVYLAGVVVWVGLIGLGPLLLNQITNPTRARWLEVFSPVYLSGFSELWGFFPKSNLAWWQTLWFAGFGLALAALAAVVHKAWRDRDFRRTLSTWVLVLAMLGAGSGFGGYYSAFVGQLATADRQVARLLDPRGTGSAGGTGRFAVTAYDLGFTVADGHSLLARGTVVVRNTGAEPTSEIWLTLNATFEVSEVTGAGSGGPAVSGFTREGDFLTVLLAEPLPPRGEATLSLAYGGTVWDFAPSQSNTGLHLVAGVDRRGLWLPAGYCWYPAAGHQRLALAVDYDPRPGAEDWRLWFSGVRFDPALYRMSFSGASDLVLASSFGEGRSLSDGWSFEGRTATEAGVFVIGGPGLAITDSDGGPAIAAPGLVGAERALGSRVRAALDTYQALLPVEVPERLAIVAVPAGVLIADGPQPGEGLVLEEVEGATLAKLDVRFIAKAAGVGLSVEREVLGLLMNPGSPDRSASTHSQEPGLEVRLAFRDFLEAVGLAASGGTEAYESRLEDARSFHAGGFATDGRTDAYIETLARLDELYRAGGPDSVRILLAQVWADMASGNLLPTRLLTVLRGPGDGGAGQ